MGPVRQAASGIVYAILSLLLVMGSLSLALAQGGTASPAPATFTAVPSTTTRPAPESTTATPLPSASPTSTAAATQSRPTATYEYPTLPPPAGYSAGTPPGYCGAPEGWVRAYVVQPGETLFRIAEAYGITAELLQRANCHFDMVIFAGEWLWVPFPPGAPPATYSPDPYAPIEPATAETSNP